MSKRDERVEFQREISLTLGALLHNIGMYVMWVDRVLTKVEEAGLIRNASGLVRSAHYLLGSAESFIFGQNGLQSGTWDELSRAVELLRECGEPSGLYMTPEEERLTAENEALTDRVAALKMVNEAFMSGLLVVVDEEDEEDVYEEDPLT